MPFQLEGELMPAYGLIIVAIFILVNQYINTQSISCTTWILVTLMMGVASGYIARFYSNSSYDQVSYVPQPIYQPPQQTYQVPQQSYQPPM